MKVLTKIIYIFAFIIFTGIFLILFHDLENKLISFSIIAIFLLISLVCTKIKINDKVFCSLLFILAFILRIITVLYMKVTPSSDFAVLLDAAENLIKGTNVMNTSPYFITWSYQSGFVLYQAFILKIFNSITVLHIFDCFFTASICVFVYIIGKEINKEANILPAILYSFYIFAIVYTGVLSNQHFFTFIVLIVIFILLKNTKFEKIKDFIIGLLLGIANILRPEGIVVLVSIIGYKLLKIGSKKEIKKTLVGICIVCLTYFAITLTVSFIIQVTNINHNGLKNNNPLWKFVCGSDYETGGCYSIRGEAVFGNIEQEKTFIIQNYKSLNLKTMLKFFVGKIRNFWTISEGYYWAFADSWVDGRFIDKYVLYDLSIYTFIFISTLISIFTGIREKRNGKTLLVLILLVNFAVYLLIEIQVRYSYTVKIIMFILATDGINQLLLLIKSYKDKPKKLSFMKEENKNENKQKYN